MTSIGTLATASAERSQSSGETEATIARLLASGMGLLAADESLGTIARRFEGVGVESTEATRRAYRELLFTAPGIGEQISGVILFDETIRQQAADGTPFPNLLERRGAIPGIKVDLGARPLAFAPGESVTDGLDGLRDRLAEYRSLGARFTSGTPSWPSGRARPASTPSPSTPTPSPASPRSMVTRALYRLLSTDSPGVQV